MTYTSLPNETVTIKQLFFAVEDDELHRDVLYGSNYRLECIEVHFRHKTGEPWILDKVAVIGPKILKNGSVGKEPVACFFFDGNPKYRLDDVLGRREIEQGMYEVPDVVYEVLAKHWPEDED